MNKLIQLKTRGENNYLKMLLTKDKEESKTFVLKVETPTLSTGYTETGKKFINPASGPMMVVGEEVEGAGILKSIDCTMGYGYTLSFE